MAKERKLPWMKFVADDWLSNTAVLSPESRGAWVDLLCWMHLNGRTGIFSGTTETLVRICRSTPALIDKFIDELEMTEVADVTKGNANVTENSTQSNAKVTVINRRMNNEYKERSNSKLRKKRYDDKKRCNAQSNASVTVQKTEDRRQKTEDRENIISLSNFFERSISDEIWLTDLMRATKCDNPKYWLNEFNDYVKGTQENHQVIQRYRSHAVNWIRGEIKRRNDNNKPIGRARRQAT